jgi:hypothetical protein
LCVDRLQRATEHQLIPHDQGAAEIGFRRKMVMQARLRDGELLRDIGVAEAVETACLRESLGDVEDLLGGWRADGWIWQAFSPRSDLILPTGKYKL